MEWFKFLKKEGYFNPINNPEPIAVEKGHFVPFWEALSYLEKLSLQMREGKYLELVDELLSILKEVSEHPKDNYRTWYWFIKILNNIPNDKIPTEILHYIPVWLSGRFDNSVESSEICQLLLPKFLNETPTSEDIQKTEIILSYLFKIERLPATENEIIEKQESSYRSLSHLYYLSTTFKSNALISKIVKYCREDFILDIGASLKKLLLDFPNGINTKYEYLDVEYDIKYQIEDTNIFVSLKKTSDPEFSNASVIEYYEDLSQEEIKNKLISIFHEHDIEYTQTHGIFDPIENLYFALNKDLFSGFRYDPISTLGDKYRNEENISYIFARIFRDLLNEKAKIDSCNAIKILRYICFDKKFGISFYKRIALFVIAENWNGINLLFWELVTNNDSLKIFSNQKYHKELFELLKKNQGQFTQDEKLILKRIIGNGEQLNKTDEDDRNYWKLRWYSALKDIEPFDVEYLRLSHTLNITSEHYEHIGEIRLRSGSVSPISKADLLLKSNEDIVNLLQSFQPKDRWEEPNITGLAETLKNAIEEDPQKFAERLNLYNEVSYIYAYNILYALSDAWKKNKGFDWEKVLIFCLDYISNPKFYSGEFKRENDDWRANADWVIGAIGYLLTTGLQNDENAFEPELLPIAKSIIQILTKNIECIDDFKDSNFDYPTYSYNSTAGKVLRALIDYSLRRARTQFLFEDAGKWEPEIQSLFEEALKKGIIDTYILEGMYFRQFYFLDKEWTTDQVKQHYRIEDREWLGFFGGFIFGDPPFNKDMYILFYPHFEKAINRDIDFKGTHSNALIRHLVSFYFWGYEHLSADSLCVKFLTKTKSNNIVQFVQFIKGQTEYFKGLNTDEKAHFELLILNLWKYLDSKYGKPKHDEEKKILASLSGLVEFASEINEPYTQLMLRSCAHVEEHYYSHELLENLGVLKTKGNPVTSANSIAQILSILPFKDYIDVFDQKQLIELISFLFDYGQNEAAIRFCNRMATRQMDFLREVYEEKMSKN